MIKTKAPTGNILTYSGLFVDPLNIEPKDIKLVDISHALSNLCRYNGHVNGFYSVAQHSVIVAQQFKDMQLRKWGLFHDASEAFLGDVVAPLKHCGHYDFYLEAEEILMKAVAERFELEWPMPEEVDFIDKTLRGNEMRDLKDYIPEDSSFIENLTIKTWLPQRAKYEFIWEAEELGVFY